MLVNNERLICNVPIPLDMLDTTEMGDGSFGRVRAGSKDFGVILRIRELVKYRYLAQRLCKQMSTEHPGSVRRVHLVVVPRADVANPREILERALQDPDVLDYSKVWGFRVLLELSENLPDGAPAEEFLRDALRKILEVNNLACGNGTAPAGGADGGGERQGGHPKRRRMEKGVISPQEMRREVYRTNEEVHLYDDQDGLFRFGEGSKDWSLTLLNDTHLMAMFESVTDTIDYRKDEWMVAGSDPHERVFNATRALRLYDNNNWNTVPRGAHPDYWTRIPTDAAGDVDMASGNGGMRLFHYTISASDFSNPEIFLTKRFPKFWPTHSGLYDRVLGCTNLQFLEQAKVADASNNQSIWVRLRDAIAEEKIKQPVPGPEFRQPGAGGAPLVVQRKDASAADGWRCVLKLRGPGGVVFAPMAGAEYNKERREWSAFHNFSDEYRITERSAAMLEGFSPLVEMSIKQGGRIRKFTLVQEGDVRRFETPQEADARLRSKWLRVYFDECWNPEHLMSEALGSTIKYFHRFFEEEGTNLPFPGDGRVGWTFNRTNLNPQLNFFAMLLDVLEFPLNMHVNHQNAVRGMLAFKGINKGDHKPPHMLWVGAMAAGKSWLALLLKDLMPSPIFQIASHQSSQAFYTQAPCPETYTGQKVFFYDEGNARKLGMRDKKTMSRADNSTEQENQEYKESLTNRVTESSVLGWDDKKQRRLEKYLRANDNVQVRGRSPLEPPTAPRGQRRMMGGSRTKSSHSYHIPGDSRTGLHALLVGPHGVTGTPSAGALHELLLRPGASDVEPLHPHLLSSHQARGPRACGGGEQQLRRRGAHPHGGEAHVSVPLLPADAAGDAAVRGHHLGALHHRLAVLLQEVQGDAGEALPQSGGA